MNNIVNIVGENNELNVAPSGENVAELRIAEKLRLEYSCATCNKFMESSAIPVCNKVHVANDELIAGVELTREIPFGCEFIVKREINCANGFAKITTDFSAKNGGKIENISLGTLRFTNWSSAKFLLSGANTWMEINTNGAGEIEYYNGKTPIAALCVKYADGFAVEYFVSSDLWRHEVAKELSSGSCAFCLKQIQNGVLEFERIPVQFETNEEVPKRPWRFKEFLAWGQPNIQAVKYDNLIKLPEGCMMSPVNQRWLRKTIRRSQNSVTLFNAQPNFCTDASHLERAYKAKLIHCDLEEIVSDYIWATRELVKKSCEFTMLCDENNTFYDTVAIKNLSVPYKKLKEIIY